MRSSLLSVAVILVFNRIDIHATTDSAPTWVDPMLRLEYSLLAGDDLELECKARGHPRPTIQWYKDDKLLTNSSRFNNEPITFRKWKLIVPDLISVHDEGSYTCVVSNEHGMLQHSYKLIVIVRHIAPPEFNRKPQNTTVSEGETVVLHCEAHSELNTITQWLKRVEINGSYVEETNRTVNFRRLETGGRVMATDRQLVIGKAMANDSGIYVCYIANQKGSVQAEAWVTVRAADSPNIMQIALYSAAAFGISFLTIAMFCCVRRCRKAKSVVYVNNLPGFEANGSSKGTKYLDQLAPSVNVDVQEFISRNCQIPTKSVRLCEAVGEGNFGIVHRAILNGQSTVAVKMLKDNSWLTSTDMVDFMKEVQLMMSLGCHDNVIQLIGCSLSKTGDLRVIMEYAAHGNLRCFLRCHRPGASDSPTRRQYVNDPNSVHCSPLSQEQLASFAIQIASGMEYLASKRVIHRDLAARNILVADGFVAKIADFGLTRQVLHAETKDYYRKHNKLVGRLPIKWMSPEAMAAHVYTSKSDVWSYGVLLWEIYSHGDSPYPSVPLPSLYQTLRDGYRMPKPDTTSDKMYDVMRKCWSFSPEYRPTFSELVKYIRQIVRDDLPLITDFNVSQVDSILDDSQLPPMTPHIFHQYDPAHQPRTAQLPTTVTATRELFIVSTEFLTTV